MAEMLVPRCCSLPEIRKLSLSQQPSVSMGLGRGRWRLGSGYTRNVKYRLQRPETDSAPDVAHIASPDLRDIFLWNCFYKGCIILTWYTTISPTSTAPILMTLHTPLTNNSDPLGLNLILEAEDQPNLLEINHLNLKIVMFCNNL